MKNQRSIATDCHIELKSKTKKKLSPDSNICQHKMYCIHSAVNVQGMFEIQYFFSNDHHSIHLIRNYLLFDDYVHIVLLILMLVMGNRLLMRWTVSMEKLHVNLFLFIDTDSHSDSSTFLSSKKQTIVNIKILDLSMNENKILYE